jgi:hypothetical protein
MVRDVAYESLPKRERQRLHQHRAAKHAAAHSSSSSACTRRSTSPRVL